MTTKTTSGWGMHHSPHTTVAVEMGDSIAGRLMVCQGVLPQRTVRCVTAAVALLDPQGGQQ